MHKLTDLELSDIYLGQTVDYIHTVTESEIDRFAELSGDFNPLHISDNYAIDNGFKERVAHGFLLGAYISGVIGMLLPGRRCLLLDEQLSFPKPVYPGDRVTIYCVVAEIWEDLSMFEIRVRMKKKDNSTNKVVTVARGKVQCQIRS